MILGKSEKVLRQTPTSCSNLPTKSFPFSEKVFMPPPRHGGVASLIFRPGYGQYGLHKDLCTCMCAGECVGVCVCVCVCTYTLHPSIYDTYWPFGWGEMRKRSYEKPLPRAEIFLQNRFRSENRCSCHPPAAGGWPV